MTELELLRELIAARRASVCGVIRGPFMGSVHAAVCQGLLSREQALALFRPAQSPEEPELFDGLWTESPHNLLLAIRIVLKEEGICGSEEALHQMAEDLYPHFAHLIADNPLLGIAKDLFLYRVRAGIHQFCTHQDKVSQSYKLSSEHGQCYRRLPLKAQKAFHLLRGLWLRLLRSKSKGNCACGDQATTEQQRPQGQ